MLPGFNHNLRHKGLVFHVQTEDNGVSNPYIVTHVFFGGNIIVSRRQSYQKFAQVPQRSEIVGSMMKEQHKDIMKEIVEGKLRGVQEVLVREGIEKEEHVTARAVDDFHSTPAPAKEPPSPKPSPRPVQPQTQEPTPTPQPVEQPKVATGAPIGKVTPVTQPSSATPAAPKHTEAEPPKIQPKPRLVEKPAARTLDTSKQVEKSLDELILDFLNDEKKNR